MRLSHLLTFTTATILLGWFAFVTMQYAQHRIRVKGIAHQLQMDDRVFHILPGSLNPPTAIAGEERLLVVGESDNDFLLCSIVRSSQYTDFRGQWKLDVCFRPDLQPEHPRLAVWESLDHFPTETDLTRFRSDALRKPWVKWDCPQGSNPENGG
ncbi:hypothetical protein CEE69_20905 [Rhodopirellula bahusiensis]|uniref:Uncharacterized protein n=1 Tax=Rhodopirellula bahusiensis TaxID=2014065 RepID=A0A2G1W361_9BACT|nr:hypothetical protein CEE69_20905 [Rhodopirellula bahusiensis]